MGTILDFERIGILLNSFSVISGFCADMLDRNCFGQCIHFGGLYPFCELVHSTAEGYRRCLASDRAAVPAPAVPARIIMFTAAISA